MRYRSKQGIYGGIGGTTLIQMPFCITLPAVAMCIVGVYLLDQQVEDHTAGILVLAFLGGIFLCVMICQGRDAARFHLVAS